MATLVLELSLTRIFSAVFAYHFAFLAISIALFGLSSGCMYSYTIGARGVNLFVKIGELARLNCLMVLLSLVFLLMQRGAPGFFTIAVIFVTAAIPFFLAGTILALAATEAIERLDQVRFVDFLGGAAGCIVLVPFLNYLGGPNTVLTSAVPFAVGSAIWFHCGSSAGGRATAVVLALILVALIAYNGRSRLLVDSAPAATMEQTGAGKALVTGAVSEDRPVLFYTPDRALPVLLGVFVSGVLATGLVLVVPPLVMRPRIAVVRGFAWRFIVLGAAYILIEVAFIEKFILFLGRPVYSLAVVVCTMLLASGLGSLCSRRLSMTWIPVAIAAVIGVLAFITTPIEESAQGLALPLRILIAGSLLAPAGFLMGIPFAAALKRIESSYAHAIRQGWALNAAGGVLGAAGAMMIAVYFGLRATLLAGAGLYLVALLAERIESKRFAAARTTEPAAMAGR